MALTPGARLLNGQYRIIHQVGRGGFGFVYCAREKLTGDTVAIKELVPALVTDPKMVQRFIQEARSTQHLTHPNIVRTHNIFEDGGNYYLVMEYLAGGSLADRLQQGPLSLVEALSTVNALCAALSYAHAHGVVHCDLKPANVLFDAEGTAHVADFGIAHVSEELMTRQFFTATGVAMGTVQYMAPEQLEGVRDDPRLDVYALGTLLYEMLAGRPYLDFETETTPAAQVRNIQRIQNNPPRPLREANPAVPAWLAQVVERALSKAPEKRHTSAEELAAAVSQQKAETAPTAPRTVWLWLAGAAAAVLLLLIVAVAVVAFRPGESQVATPLPSPTIMAQATATLKLVPSKIPSPTWTPSNTLVPTPMPQPTSMPEPTVTPGIVVPVERRIVFHSKQDGNYEICVVLPDGTERVNLTKHPAKDRNPGWSPDGQWIVFDSNRSGRRSIWRMAADGSDLRQLTSGKGTDSAPDWSPDGTRIAYVSTRDGDQELYVMNADGSGQTRLTYHTGNEAHPDWSPDGQWIAFNARWDDNYEIYLVPSAGGNAVRLTHAAGDDSAPAWSPNGTRIAFDSDRNGQYDIWVMNADGSGQTCLVDHPAVDGFPAWSPDGQQLVFDSNRDGGGDNWDLYTIRIDGSNLQRITYGGGENWYPDWGP